MFKVANIIHCLFCKEHDFADDHEDEGLPEMTTVVSHRRTEEKGIQFLLSYVDEAGLTHKDWVDRADVPIACLKSYEVSHVRL